MGLKGLVARDIVSILYKVNCLPQSSPDTAPAKILFSALAEAKRLRLRGRHMFGPFLAAVCLRILELGGVHE